MFFNEENYMLRFTIIILVFCAICFVLFCEKDFTPYEKKIETIPPISLEVEKVKVKELWLKLKIVNSDTIRTYQIYRDSILIKDGTLKSSDSTFYDYNLLPDHKYTYKAYLLKSDSIKCDSTTITIKTKDYVWQSLGFDDKFALKLKLNEPYIYVCAGIYGIWRKDIRTTISGWEYIGLSDTTLGQYINRGVQDVLVYSENEDWLLASYIPDIGGDPCIYRSLDDGQNWERADSSNYDSLNIEACVQRFLEYQNRIIGGGHGVWITTDFGKFWVHTEAQIGAWVNSFERHPFAQNIIWLGGEGIYFNPVLGFSNDAGYTWTEIDLGGIVPYDNAVYSIAYDLYDFNTVYVGMQGAIIKTTDSGQSWISPLVTSQSGYFFRAILPDPNNASHIWAAAGNDFIETWDKGENWQEVETNIPLNKGIFDMIWDDVNEIIYVSTFDGIYNLKP